MPWYTYIVRCADGTLYTGCTSNVEARVAKHNAGTGAKFCRGMIKRPVVVVYVERFETKSEAMSREYAIKKLTKQQKEELCRASTLISTSG